MEHLIQGEQGLPKWALPAFIGIIVLSLGPYTAADITGQRTAIRVPVTAKQIAYPLASREAFIMPRTDVSQVNCGGTQTFLGSIYDDSGSRFKTVQTIATFESEMKASNHTLSRREIAGLRYSLPTDRVVTCDYSPRIEYSSPETGLTK